MIGIEDDHSADFGKLRRSVSGPNGTRLVELIDSLSPDFRVVYRDIAMGYAMIAAILVLSAVGIRLGASPWLVIPIVALATGY